SVPETAASSQQQAVEIPAAAPSLLEQVNNSEFNVLAYFPDLPNINKPSQETCMLGKSDYFYFTRKIENANDLKQLDTISKEIYARKLPPDYRIIDQMLRKLSNLKEISLIRQLFAFMEERDLADNKIYVTTINAGKFSYDWPF